MSLLVGFRPARFPQSLLTLTVWLNGHASLFVQNYSESIYNLNIYPDQNFISYNLCKRKVMKGEILLYNGTFVCPDSGSDLISNNNSNQTLRFWKIIPLFGTCQVPVLDHWWQTETSHAITSTCVGLGHDLNPPVHSSGKPVPGYDVRILRQDGSEANDGEFGRCGHLFNYISLSLLTATLSCE